MIICITENNTEVVINTLFLILCLKTSMANIIPKTPPIDDKIISVVSGMRHLFRQALNLSMPIAEKVTILSMK